jgi:drug/metabolite transporter (DMT)-like permease
MKSNEKWVGIILVGLGSALFSIKAVVIKWVFLNYRIEPLGLLGLRFGIALPIFASIAIYRFRKNAFKSIVNKDWLQIAFLALLGYYIASWLDFEGLKYISAALERIILFIYPTLVLIISAIFLKKKMALNSLLALSLTYLGIIITVLEPRFFQAQDFWWGSLLIFISAFTYAIYLAFGTELIQKYGSINFNALAMVLSCVYVLAHVFIFKPSVFIGLEKGEILWGAFLAVFCTVLPTFISMEGMKRLGAAQGAIVTSLGPVVTLILGNLILGEHISLQEVLGTFFVLLGVIMIGK